MHPTAPSKTSFSAEVEFRSREKGLLRQLGRGLDTGMQQSRFVGEKGTIGLKKFFASDVG